MLLLTDLPIDVFPFILSHLGYIDLVNLADSSQYLRNIVKASNKLRFTEMMILSGSVTFNHAFLRGKRLIVFGFKLILKLLRLFGPRLKSLYINVIKEKMKIFRIIGHVNFYCSHLQTMILRSIQFDLSSCFVHAFQSVSTLCLEFGFLHSNLCHLSNFFPNLKILYIFKVRFHDVSKFIERHKHLCSFVLNSPDLRSDDLILLKQLNFSADFECVKEWNEYLGKREIIFK